MKLGIKVLILFFSGVGIFLIGAATGNAIVLGITALIGLTVSFIGFLMYASSILGEPSKPEVSQE